MVLNHFSREGFSSNINMKRKFDPVVRSKNGHGKCPFDIKKHRIRHVTHLITSQTTINPHIQCIIKPKSKSSKPDLWHVLILGYIAKQQNIQTNKIVFKSRCALQNYLIEK